MFRLKKILWLITGTGCLFVGTLVGEAPVYVFWRVDVTTRTKWGDAPVVSAGRWGLRVETPVGEKRVSYKEDFRLDSKACYASQVVEVSKFKVTLSNQARDDREVRAMADLNASKSGSEFAMAELAGDGRNISARAQRQIEAVQEEYQEIEDAMLDSIESGNFDAEGLNDSVNIELEMLSPSDFEAAYAVVVVTYNIPDSAAPLGRKITRVGRIIRIGDIKANDVKKSRLRMKMAAGYLEDAHYTFSLITGQSENIATTKSVDLRRLTPAELAELNL